MFGDTKDQVRASLHVPARGHDGGLPDSIHDLLCDEEPLSDTFSTGDNYLGDAHASPHMCAMATAPREQPQVVELSNTTHTPPDHWALALANAQVHAAELRTLPVQAHLR